MSGTQFSAPTPTPAVLDPFKRVDYQLGMVLGVDDFTQESTFHIAHRDWLTRDAIGYGTTSGLSVSRNKDGTKPEIIVAPGAGITPRGHLVRVPSTQCALLNDWLATNGASVTQWLPISGLTLQLYVVLCYRECETDDVPIPGEPCRDESELLKPSRIADDFRLELRFRAPDEREELAVVAFVAWLKKHIKVSPDPSVDKDLFAQSIRDAAVQTSPPTDPEWWPVTSPPGVPLPFMQNSPPSPLNVNTNELDAYLKIAIRVWTTELRPRFRPDWLHQQPSPTTPMAPQPDDGDCILLAALTIPLSTISPTSGVYTVSNPSLIVIDETARPVLLHLRMLQELLSEVSAEGGATISPASAVTAETGWDQPTSAGIGLSYSRGDHTHGTPPNPVPPHDTAAAAHNNLAIAGDVTGTPTTTKVVKLQGSPVAAASPTAAGQLLTWNGSAWIAQVPAPVAIAVTLGGEVTGPAASTVVSQLQGIAIKGPPPAAMGQTLSFDNVKKAWIAAYGVIAAGTVDLSQNAVQVANYNNLKLVVAAASESGTSRTFTVAYDGYVQPDPKNPLVVKAIVLRSKFSPSVAMVVEVARFAANGVVLRIAPLPGEGSFVDGVQVQIEVSQYHL